MTLRQKFTSIGLPGLSQLADFAEYGTFAALTATILTVAVFGVTGAVLGFTLSLAIAFAQVVLGSLLVAGSLFAFSLMVGIIEGTYGESVPSPEEMSEAQESDETEQERRGPSPPREVEV